MRVNGLGSTNNNSLNTNEGERRVDKGRQEPQEVPGAASNTIVVHPRPRVVPVPEADGVAVGPAAGGDDDGHDDQAEEAEHLDGAADDLALAVDADRHQVQRQDEHQADGDDDGGRDVGPERHQHGGGGALGRDGDGVAVAVRNCQREADGRVDEAGRPVGEGAGGGNLQDG